MKNNTNLIKYNFLAPIYDLVFNPFLAKARKKAFMALDFTPGDGVLLVGVGTGLDIPLIPKECLITGIDLSAEMLKRAEVRVKGRQVELYQMNAENLEFKNQSFHFVVLNLILSVAENPKKVLAEAVRVLDEQGKILVFDKFIKGKRVGFARNLLNKMTSLVGTDITRSFEEIRIGLPLKILNNEGSIFGGNYRIILLRKENGTN